MSCKIRTRIKITKTRNHVVFFWNFKQLNSRDEFIRKTKKSGRNNVICYKNINKTQLHLSTEWKTFHRGRKPKKSNIKPKKKCYKLKQMFELNAYATSVLRIYCVLSSTQWPLLYRRRSFSSSSSLLFYFYILWHFTTILSSFRCVWLYFKCSNCVKPVAVFGRNDKTLNRADKQTSQTNVLCELSKFISHLKMCTKILTEKNSLMKTMTF